MNYIGLRIILKRINAIRFMMKDKMVPWYKKALVVFGIVYLIMPVDLIPITLFPVAGLDDLVLWGIILYYLRDELDKYWLGEKVVDLSGHFRDKNIVDDVKYEVDAEKQDKGKEEDDDE